MSKDQNEPKTQKQALDVQDRPKHKRKHFLIIDNNTVVIATRRYTAENRQEDT